MKKSKKKPVYKYRPRKKVSGSEMSDVYTTIGGALAGFVAGKMLASDKILPKLDDKIKGAGIAAIGLFAVPMLSTGKLAKGVTIGMAVAGGELILTSAKIISGYDTKMVAYPRTYQMAGGSGISETVSGAGINQTVGNMRRAYKEA
jgi:hypothetical protein